jgi:hypothetical protein
MDGPSSKGLCFQYASFLIRLWRSTEPEGGQVSGWHSEVEHIQSGETWSFNTLAELEGFFSQQAIQPEGLEWIELKIYENKGDFK